MFSPLLDNGLQIFKLSDTLKKQVLISSSLQRNVVGVKAFCFFKLVILHKLGQTQRKLIYNLVVIAVQHYDICKEKILLS